MTNQNIPVAPAIRQLREHNIQFIPHLYAYEEKGGTRGSAIALNVDEHHVVKTLVMVTDERKPLLVLMDGDRDVSTKQLARLLGVKRIEPADSSTTQKHTGYLFGGTSPFGTRSRLDVYIQESIFKLRHIYINGGKRGFLIQIDPQYLRALLPVVEVDVAIQQ